MKFTVAKELFERLPEACFGVVAVRGLDNSVSKPAVEAMLSHAIAEAEDYFENVKIKESPDIAPYREAFRALDINPNKFMCSIEALLSRVAKKKGLPSINPVVDLGNAVSVKYRIPLGAHDLGSMAGDIEIRPSLPDDTFVPFGSTEAETPDKGEMVYVSGGEVRTRRWTWRQSEKGKITSATSSVFFPLDGFGDVNKTQVLAARDELAALLHEHFGCTAIVGFVDANTPEFSFVWG